MVKTITLETEISASRELRIKLPADTPTGRVAVVVTVSSRGAAAAPTFGDLLKSEFFGTWRDRTDIEDSLEFAENLRRHGWKRPA